MFTYTIRIRHGLSTSADLLIFMILLGTAHMFLMASQQMLTVRCANCRGRDDAFG